MRPGWGGKSGRWRNDGRKFSPVKKMGSSVKTFTRQKPLRIYQEFIIISVIIAPTGYYILNFFFTPGSVFYQAVLSIFIFLSVILVFKKLRRVKTETVIFLSTVGVQMNQFDGLGFMLTTRFIPKSNIKSFIINETIQKQRIICYLALILHSPDTRGHIIIPLFKEILPRLAVIKNIYKDAYELTS